MKIYDSYNTNLQSPFDTPRKKEDQEEIVLQGGYLMEILLINSVEYLNIEHILFLLNENNWTLDHKTFLSKFKEIKEPKLENCMKLVETGKMTKRLFIIFKINQKSLGNAIESKIILNTQYSLKFNNEVGFISLEEKYGTKKNYSNAKEQRKRICRTHDCY